MGSAGMSPPTVTFPVADSIVIVLPAPVASIPALTSTLPPAEMVIVPEAVTVSRSNTLRSSGPSGVTTLPLQPGRCSTTGTYSQLVTCSILMTGTRLSSVSKRGRLSTMSWASVKTR